MNGDSSGISNNGIPLKTNLIQAGFPLKRNPSFSIEGGGTGLKIQRQAKNIGKITRGIPLKKDPGTDEIKLKKATKDFEAIFLRQLLKVMRSTVPESQLLSGGIARDFYESMMDEIIAQKAAEAGKTNFGDMIFRYLTRERNRNIELSKEGSGTNRY